MGPRGWEGGEALLSLSARAPRSWARLVSDGWRLALCLGTERTAAIVPDVYLRRQEVGGAGAQARGQG